MYVWYLSRCRVTIGELQHLPQEPAHRNNFSKAACVVRIQLTAMLSTSAAVRPMASMQPPEISDGPPVEDRLQSRFGSEAQGSLYGKLDQKSSMKSPDTFELAMASGPPMKVSTRKARSDWLRWSDRYSPQATPPQSPSMVCSWSWNKAVPFLSCRNQPL